MRSKIPELEEALAATSGAPRHRLPPDHRPHRLPRPLHRRPHRGDHRRLVPFEAAVAIVTSIPGISRTTAEVIVAETGADMSRFPTPGQLCAWAGVAPASYESAGKRRPAGTRHGSQWLRRALIEAARRQGRAPRAATTPLSTRASRGEEVRTRPPSRSRTRCCSLSGTSSPTAPSSKTPERTTSSAVTIQPSRRSDSHGGSRRSGSTSASPRKRHSPLPPTTSAFSRQTPRPRATFRSRHGITSQRCRNRATLYISSP